MSNHYPTPQEMGIKPPFYLNGKAFERGFLYALKGKTISDNHDHSRSFSKGYEMGALVFNELY